jgi:hypothetical protein
VSGVNTIATEQQLAREAQGVAVSSPGEVAAEEETLAAAEQRIRSYSKRGIGSVKEMGRELIIAEKSAGLLDRRPDDPKKTAKCSAEF